MKLAGLIEFKLKLLTKDPNEYAAFLLLRKAWDAEHVSEEHFANVCFRRGLEVLAHEAAQRDADDRLIKLPHEVKP